jgi:hypothetical protein
MKDHTIFGIAAGIAILGLVLLAIDSLSTTAPAGRFEYPEVYGEDTCTLVKADITKGIKDCAEDGRLQCETLHPSSPTGPVNLCYLACYRDVQDQCEYSHSRISSSERLYP